MKTCWPLFLIVGSKSLPNSVFLSNGKARLFLIYVSEEKIIGHINYKVILILLLPHIDHLDEAVIMIETRVKVQYSFVQKQKYKSSITSAAYLRNENYSKTEKKKKEKEKQGIKIRSHEALTNVQKHYMSHHDIIRGICMTPNQVIMNDLN